jgi:putative ABC transport system permease protein
MFVLRMAWREMRASWRRLLFFFLCLAIGVGSIITLRSVVQGVRATLLGEARTLLGADLVISTNRPWDPKARDAVERRLAQAPVVARLDEVETLSMVRPADATKAVARLVELRGVQAGYPLYGALALEGATRYSHQLLRSRGVLVRPELLTQLSVAVGDEVVIGETRFSIRGVVLGEPGRRAGAFSFGSRVFIDLEDLRGAGLLGVGSRASYRVMLKLAGGEVQRLARDLRQAFRGQFVSVRTYQSTEDQLGRDLERTENYLSLVGLVIVALGGVGVWSVIRVFVQQKLRTIAILKCVGSTTRQILLVYVVQVLVMGAAGSLLGVALATGALWWVRPAVADAVGVDAALSLTGSAVIQGAGIGVLVSLLFALVPLLDIRHVRPSLLLRVSDGPGAPRDWARSSAILAIGAALVALAAWQAGSWRVGAILAGGFVGISVVLVGAGVLLVKAIAPLQRSRSLALRYAARRVGRPGSQVRAVLLAVGLGAFMVVGVRALQENLLSAFQVEVRPDTPDMFLIDVQPDQADAVRAFLVRPDVGVRGEPHLIPVLRARVTGVRGRQVILDGYEDVRGRGGGLGREYVVTYRPRLERNERVVSGEFWPPTPGAAAEVSIEQGMGDRQGLGLGDLIRFDILGRVVEARVTSVRNVEWADARAGGFMFVFRPGVLDAAPQTFIAPLKGPADAGRRARFQRDLTARFPNVSVVDVQEILTAVTKVLGSVTLAVTVVGSLVAFSGILILIGSISMTRFQRTYEAAVLKTLGATTRRIAAMLAVEYGLLGFLAGVIGSAGALVLSWAVSAFVLDVPWQPTPALVVAGILASSALVTVVGILASLNVLRRKPLATLRAE